ncbi:MBL fold metallo-hydrolase [Caenimonas sedimenti]|uniref:MBL fold metallo-hydrolase n=1 Tax=Caenimonas sedimenti TaxID=2596921 RepID=A0A562ZQD5_9BURK|nr:MBL fold metallo-hydrolase [Caenimonas sedimenti]TWO70753.1 MBL fold metallo-hydrolase [Caenimonas sedimenti]
MPVLPAGVRVLERGWLSSNNILFVDGDQPAIVDSGYATHAGLTLDLVRRAFGSTRPALLVNTHLHSDHCGGNAGLQREYPAMRTLIPPGQADQVRAWDPVALTFEPTGQQCPRFSFDGVLAPGSEVQLGRMRWQVHAAPGHDPHSVVLFEPGSRVLISADALWENGFGVVFPELEGVDAFDEVARTLDLIERLDPTCVIPGHGAIFSDAAKALARARRRLEGYVSDPVRHATHAAKVLLKFKLLELQSVTMPECVAWAASTAYFGVVHERWFADVGMGAWIESLSLDLIRSGAAKLENGILLNA